MSSPAFVFSPAYETDIGPHVFPTQKYRLVRDRLRAEGAGEDLFVEPEEGDRALLELVHEPQYIRDLFGLRIVPSTLSSELPLTERVVEWFETAVYGTITAGNLARVRGAAMHIGGGFHHAFAGHAEGFCYLNDTAVAARNLLETGEARTISVVDVDVHQGNGTARIFRDEPRVFTFSIHQENNYPLKEKSDLDIGLPDGAEDEEYLTQLSRGLEQSVRLRNPDAVYYVAGADPFREDMLGGLGVSLEGLRERDRRVFAACAEVGAKVVVMLAGGYAGRLADTITIHVQTAEELLSRWP